MDNTENIISFCTGYGGIELGLRRVIPNLRTVAYVEIEAFACTNLVAKIEQGKMDAAPIWTDIKIFDGKPFRGRVHGIIGGYPCQPFSSAGQRKGTDDPRHLWPYIEEHIRTIRPVWCFFENVSGHLSLGFKEVAQSLRDLGYKVEAGLFTAAEVGAPHKRERLFILAHTRHNAGGTEQEQQQKERTKEHNGGCELADTEQLRPVQLEHTARHRKGVSEDGSLGPAMADTSGTEYKRRQSQSENNDKKFQAITGSCSIWPARPGQAQYDWEEPRTI